MAVSPDGQFVAVFFDDGKLVVMAAGAEGRMGRRFSWSAMQVLTRHNTDVPTLICLWPFPPFPGKTAAASFVSF